MISRVGRMALAGALMSGILGSCGSTPESEPAPNADAGSGSSTTQDTNARVVVKGNVYDPPSIDIPQGAKVVWGFEDGDVPHTVTSDNNVFGSPPNGQTSGAFEYVFEEAGTFAYHCDFHPEMVATVNVR